MIQPATSPKATPAMPNAIPSDFIAKFDHTPNCRVSKPGRACRGRGCARSPLQDRQVLAYHPVEPDVECPRDDGVADRHLVQMRQGPEQDQVVEIEIVAGV